MRKARDKPVTAAIIKTISKKYFAFRRPDSAFKLPLFFFRKRRRSRKSMEAPMGQT
jgi:hypothetical protein